MIKYRVIAGRMDYRSGRIKEIYHDKAFEYRNNAVKFKDQIHYLYDDDDFFCYVKEEHTHETTEVKTNESTTKGSRRLQKIKSSRQN